MCPPQSLKKSLLISFCSSARGRHVAETRACLFFGGAEYVYTATVVRTKFNSVGVVNWVVVGVTVLSLGSQQCQQEGRCCINATC